MSSQVTQLRGIELEAWINFLRAHSAVTRQFNAELLATHGLTIARVTYAVLTAEGKKKLDEARKTHVASVRALFSERFEKDELETLASLLERLPLRDSACD